MQEKEGDQQRYKETGQLKAPTGSNRKEMGRMGLCSGLRAMRVGP